MTIINIAIGCTILAIILFGIYAVFKTAADADAANDEFERELMAPRYTDPRHGFNEFPQGDGNTATEAEQKWIMRRKAAKGE